MIPKDPQGTENVLRGRQLPVFGVGEILPVERCDHWSLKARWCSQSVQLVKRRLPSWVRLWQTVARVFEENLGPLERASSWLSPNGD